jgi:hypothetical protein
MFTLADGSVEQLPAINFYGQSEIHGGMTRKYGETVCSGGYLTMEFKGGQQMLIFVPIVS